MAASVRITSSATSSTATYLLQGVVFDNIAIKTANYQLHDAEAVELTLTDGADFSVELTLQPGTNGVTVTATDGAGNTGDAQLTVTYLAAPDGITSSSMSGRRGTSITLHGSNLGSSGSVTAGGANATITDWSETEVTFEIPAAAPDGFQSITITTSTGGGVIADFFVGEQFPGPADLAELAALNLPAGTAVLLDSGTCTIAADSIVNLDNLSLYGQGTGATIISSEDETALLNLVAGPGFDHVFTGITFETHQAFIASRPLSENSLNPIVLATSEELMATALAASSAFSTQATKHGSVTISSADFNVRENGLGLLLANPFDATLLSGDLSLADVSFSGDAVLFAAAFGDVSLERVTAATGSMLVASFLGAVSISETQIESSGSEILGEGNMGIFMTRGLSISDSSFTTNHMRVSSELFGELPVKGSRAEIHNSRFTARYSTGSSGDSGELFFDFGGLATTIEDSFFTAAYAFDVETHGNSLQLTGATFTIGHEDVDYAYLEINSQDPLADVSLTGSTMVFLSEGGPYIESQSGFRFADNRVTGHDNTGTALGLYVEEAFEPLDVTVVDNLFAGFGQALDVDADYGLRYGTEELNAVINRNVFDFPITAAPQAAYIGREVRGVLDLRNNRWGTNTDPAAVEAAIENNSGAGLTVLVAPLLP